MDFKHFVLRTQRAAGAPFACTHTHIYTHTHTPTKVEPGMKILSWLFLPWWRLDDSLLWYEHAHKYDLSNCTKPVSIL